MGHGNWDPTAYNSRMASLKATGKSAFAYSHTTTSSVPRSQWKAHADLDPKGMTVRESRDSVDHPTSLAIAVLFDVTGSMAEIPMKLQAKLPDLLSHLQQNGYVEHPQILFGAIGDATCDRVPLQVGQFESDNRMDEHVSNILLERGGGGQLTESYELGFYFLANKTSTDCFEKRGEKGFAFVFGDEMGYPVVSNNQLISIFGDGAQIETPIDDIINEVRKTWELYFIIPEETSHGKNPEIQKYWEKKIGASNVIKMANMDNVCDDIGVTIAKRVIERNALNPK